MKKKVITRQKYLLIDPKLKLKTIFFACRLSTLTKSHEKKLASRCQTKAHSTDQILTCLNVSFKEFFSD